MSITPRMWDDPEYVALSDQAKLLWAFLLTARRDSCPGLWQGGVGTFADAMRWDHEKTRCALDELLQGSFIQYDLSVQLLRVPGAPKFRPCSNGNVLKGWFRKWQDLGESELKYLHVESIKVALSDRKWFMDFWEQTFGTVKVPTPSRQVPLFLLTAAKGSDQSDSESLDSQRNAFGNAFGNQQGTNITTTRNSNQQSSINDRLDRPRVADPLERGMAAGELWRLQEELRAELAPEVVPREPTPHDLRPIMEALERYTQAELENALRVNAATAAMRPEKMEYFNGYSNWHPASLRRSVGQVIPISAGRHPVTGRTKFKGGSTICDDESF